MICPVCSAAGVRSKSFPNGPVTATMLMSESYFDEDGVPHNHDPNVATSPLRCEHGHEYEALTHVPCRFCDYGHEPVAYRVISPAN